MSFIITDTIIYYIYCVHAIIYEKFDEDNSLLSGSIVDSLIWEEMSMI